MTALQSAAVPPAEGRTYDPEIKDIADYIHNKPVDSELAVSLEGKCTTPLKKILFSAASHGHQR